MAREPDSSTGRGGCGEDRQYLGAVKWTPQHDDPHGLALDFFVQVHQALQENGVEDALHDDGKQLIELLMPKLQPAMVRDTTVGSCAAEAR
jgi:hypothetical protein